MPSQLLGEIREQPDVLDRFAAEESGHVRDVARALRARPITHVVLAARGTSDNAATYGRYLLEAFVGWPVSSAAPSLYTLYQRPPRLRDALVIGISQSGEAADVCEVVAEARRQGATTLAVTNAGASPLAGEAEHVILCRARLERSVAATKTYTAQLYALAWLTAALIDLGEAYTALLAVPDQVRDALTVEETVTRRAERYRYVERMIAVGRGYNYATCFEVALKLKELTYLTAEAYSSADFRHGPIALLERGFPVLLIAPSGATYSDLQALALEAKQRGAELLVISDRDELLGMAELPMQLPAGVPEWLSPIAAVVPGQLLACHLALARGLDPDAPRSLHKVTITR